MEKKTIKVNELNIRTTLDKYMIFDWKIEDQKDIGSGVKEFTFTRDNETPYYQELVKLENTYPNYKYPSMLWTIIFSIAAFIIVTVLMIMFFVNRSFAKSFWWIFIIPTSLCLIVTVYLTYRRIDVMKKIELDKPRIDIEYKKKVAALKEKK